MMQPYKIMVIEDDPIIQEELQTLLNGNGYEAVAVRNCWTLNFREKMVLLYVLKFAHSPMFPLSL